MPAQNFYRYNGSYYLADSHNQIANLQQLQQYAQAGGREISAPTIRPGSVAINGAQYGTSALQNANFSNIYRIGNTLYGNPLNQNINSGNVNTGSQYNNVGSQLPNGSASQTAINIYTQNALQNGQQSLQQLQQQYNQLSAQQLQQTQTNLQNTQTELNQLEQQRQADIDRYRSITDPLYQRGADEYRRMLDSLGQINYQDLIKQRLQLTQDIVNYSNLMRQELDTEAGRPALQSISQGRQSAIQQNYISKISTAQAATAAIDGNFNLAFDIMNKGATVIQNISADRLNFLNFVSGIYDSKIDDRRQRLVQLTADEKEQIDQLRAKLQQDIANVEANKAKIQEFMSNPVTAQVAHKAGVLLTDSADEFASKLNNFYAQNPQYAPQNIEIMQSLINKYPDAGITMYDTPAVAQAKVKNSAIYQREVNSGKFTYQTDANGNPVIFNSLTGQVSNGSVQIPQSSRLAYVNNNPGNLRYVGQAGAVQGEGGFARFETPEAGYQALIAQIQLDASRGLTLEQFINKYAPPSENNTGLYINQAVQALGVPKSTKIADIDINALAQFIAKKESGTVIRDTGNGNVSTAAQNWATLIQQGKADLSSVPQELRSQVVTALANSGTVSQADAQATAILNDKVALIDQIIKKVPKYNVVGPTWFARLRPFSTLSGNAQALIGEIEQLTSQETLSGLLNLKKAGGTLGALSDQERLMLQSAATKIGSWRLVKDGNVVGYRVSEKAFINELNNLKRLAQTALNNAGGQTGIVNSLEQYLSSNPQHINLYNQIAQAYPDLSDADILQVLMGQ